jgi:hypothetical protein
MNGLLVTASAAVLAGVGPFFGMGADRGKPPQPFDEKVTLPGKIPETVKSTAGAWHYQYQLKDAPLEAKTSDLLVSITLTLREDGTYELFYVARWNLPSLFNPSAGMDGRNVTENGRYTRAGEILVLEPKGTAYMEVKGNTAGATQQIPNEKHTWIVRLEKAHLNVAGRCASYQVDPVCRDTPIVWFPLSAQLGSRWLGREPR